MPLALSVLAALGLASGGPESGPPELALIHVEANVGSAGGGHSALRVDGFVYHYQRTGDGLLLLVRDNWIAFRHVYAGLQNRPLHLAHLQVDAAAANAIAGRFSKVYVTQLRELERLRRLDEDRDWWAALGDGGRLPTLRGAGLLAEAGAPAPGGIRLRDSIAQQLGSEYLGRGLADIERQLASLQLEPAGTDLERLRELLLEREVLRALLAGRGLAEQAIIADFDPAPLSSEERASLRDFGEAQRSAIVDLLDSARPDRGFALAVATARFHAVEDSLAANRLIVLGVSPDDAAIASAPDARERDDWGRAGERALTLSRGLRAEILDGEAVSETHFNLLEELFSRGMEARFAENGTAVRLFRGRQAPSRGRSLMFDLDLDDVESRAERAERLASEAGQELDAGHDYSLTERNCVTELLRTLNTSFPDDAAAGQSLGHHLEPGVGLTFIPWVAHDSVVSRLRVDRQETVPSHRHDELALLKQDEPGIATTLREACVPFATLYTPRPEDGTFLFFTEDAGALRPVLGVLNLGSGLLAGISGLLSLPFDGGDRIESGFRGAFYSLPELAFCNIRKGSYGFVDGGSRERQ